MTTHPTAPRHTSAGIRRYKTEPNGTTTTDIPIRQQGTEEGR
jgi:hypothetical protein